MSRNSAPPNFMLRHKITYDVKEILARVGSKHDRMRVSRTVKVGLGGIRLLTFRNYGTACVHCGASGAFFAVECSDTAKTAWHLNLYTADGLLLTSDHIWPTSKGGINQLINRQTLCVKCNSRKSNRLPNEKELLELLLRGINLFDFARRYHMMLLPVV